ncbi:MAG: hypothetical protein K7J15_05060 [Candidatus Regiella insecticola]|nr:hypothetical protein [Candidatus Regiella insecticola]
MYFLKNKTVSVLRIRLTLIYNLLLLLLLLLLLAYITFSRLTHSEKHTLKHIS